MRGSPLERLMAKVEKDPRTGCWNWTGYRMKNGYGTFGVGSRVDGTKRKAFTHRWSYEHHVGPIPQGFVIDHLCRNKACCNPEHLDAVPQRTNLMRAQTVTRRNALATHCLRGHPFSGDNLHVNKKGDRMCRTCMRIRSRKYFRQKNPDAPYKPWRLKD